MPNVAEIVAVERELDKANLNLSSTMRAILARRLLEARARATDAATGATPIERALVGETIVGVARSVGGLVLDTESGRSFWIAGRAVVGDCALEIVAIEQAPPPAAAAAELEEVR